MSHDKRDLERETRDVKSHRDTLSRFVSGGIAGVVANGSLQPLDVVKTRLISADKNGYSSGTR